MRVLIALLLYCVTAGFVHAQVLRLPRHPNELNAKQRTTLDEYIRKHETTTGELRILADREWIAVLSSDELRKAFPKYRFVEIRWSYHLDPHAKGLYSVPLWTSTTIAIDEGGTVVGDFPSFGNREQFGQFLKAERVRLGNDEEASRLAKIMNDLGMASNTFPNIRRSPTEWYLSYQANPFSPISGYEEIRESYYYDVQTDSDGFVVRGRLRGDVLDRRKIVTGTTSQ